MAIVSDIKVDTNNTQERISIAQETTSALKDELKSLLDKINMTSGKLNVIEQRSNDIKVEVAATQPPTKPKDNQLSHDDIVLLIQTHMKHARKSNNTKVKQSSPNGGDGDDSSSEDQSEHTSPDCVKIIRLAHQKEMKMTTAMMNHLMGMLMQKKKTQTVHPYHIIHKFLKKYETGGLVATT